MKIHIHSPEDQLRNAKWPTELPVKPVVGEWISSLDNEHTRKIARIEHQTLRNLDSRQYEYCMNIELQSALQPS